MQLNWLSSRRSWLLVVACVWSLVGGAVLHAATAGARNHLEKPDEWFHTAEAGLVTENILSWQAEAGGWPKNTDTTVPYTGERAQLQGTFDNSATTDELRFLARMIGAPASGPAAATCSNAFTRGLTHILAAQYTNGGWPQYSPPPKSYHRHITFNDNSMARLMIFLREVATEKRYEFVEAGQRAAAQRAFDRGVDCILKCQIKVDGKLTAWCAQHDEIALSPRPARTFELASLSGAESVGLTRLLMSIEKPSPEIVRAVDAAAAWFESEKIPGVELIEVKEAALPKGKDRVVKNNPAAKPMWARFYEIETGRPIYAGRDGVKKFSLAEIEHERRNGYAWLGDWPEKLLTTEYPAWKSRLSVGKN